MKKIAIGIRLIVLSFTLGLLATGCLKWEYDAVDFLDIRTGGTFDIISSTTIKVQGSIAGLKETIVTQHGHCWSAQNENPFIENAPHTSLGVRGGNGSYTSSMENLEPNQSYFVRAYAIWQDKIFYANTQEVQTGVGVSSDSVQYLAGKRAIGFGSLDQVIGANPVTDQGFVWSLENVTPMVNDNRVSANSIDENGRFYAKINELPTGATIFLRAYAIQDNDLQNDFALYGKTISIISTSANVWVERSPFPGGFGWTGAVAFTLNGKGYVGTGFQGGSFKRDFWSYDPVTDCWEKIMKFQGVGRAYAVGMTIGDKGYVGMGNTGNGTGSIDFWQYDAEKDHWFRRQNFRGGALRRGAGFSLAGQGFVIGRTDNSLWRYDPETIDWYPENGLPEYDQRYRATGFATNTYGFILGGTTNSFLGGTAFRDVWKYSHNEKKWISAGEFAGVAREGAIGVSIGESAYAGLGDSSETRPLRDFWEYRDGSWSQRAEFGGRQVSSVCSFAIDGRVYVHAADGSFWVYIPK